MLVTTYPKHQTIKLIDCRDLDQFIETHLDRKWDTLEAERDGALSGNGMITSYEAYFDPEHEYSVERDQLVQEWLAGDLLDNEINTSDILSYLVKLKVLEPGDYWVHLWW